MTTEAPKPASDESVTPASDEEVASVEPNIAKTAWETCSNCDAGLRSINVPPYLEGTHEDYCILTMWPKVIARIEHEQAANAELRAEGQKLKTAIDDLKRTVTEASMRRHEEIAALRARLAEVSQAAMAVVSNSDMATPPTIAAMAALQAILAKGDSK